MGRKPKVSYEEKIKACENYINGIAGTSQIAESLRVNISIVKGWVKKYRENGPESLMPKRRLSSDSTRSPHVPITTVIRANPAQSRWLVRGVNVSAKGMK